MSDPKTITRDFVMEPRDLFHRHGGKITKVHAIEALKGKPRDGYSCDIWFFRCDVEWDDGTASNRTEVMPNALAADNPAEHEDLQKMNAAMSDFLRETGEFRDGGWFAHRNGKKGGKQ